MKASVLSKVAVATAYFFATAVSAPLASETALASEKRAFNLCEDSTFVDESSGGSPLASDCEQMWRNNNKWPFHELTLGVERRLLEWGTCAFSATAVATPILDNIWWTNIGDEDITDLVRDSISKFTRNGRVGARGRAQCYEDTAIDWRIHHT
ncbi:putative necrosis-inducing factor-domain-containing protein [Chaetomium tenue]|uniref:Necrosis-inducing factor-domain-containing protein n=1 Tax=Chaetomium tenue TaxID=1854479 RepID=A0ACB7PJX1_9PEZI|nr:putative necrosis-inducing factor-domain-containing protein [Chaetomium globosum]